MEAIEELVQSRKLNLDMISKKWQAALRQIDSLSKGDLYVNGGSKELKDHCEETKGKIKLKENADGQDNA